MRTKASLSPQIVGFYVSGRRAAHPPLADEAGMFVLVLVSVSALAICTKPLARRGYAFVAFG
jgi:hypothetical protein